MATLKEIKQRLKSVESIHKITNAMKLVSTAKSSRAVRDLKSYGDVVFELEKVTANIARPEKEKREYKKTLYILMGSDLGLAGGYNNNVIKEFSKNYKEGDQVFVFGSKLKGLLGTKFPNLEYKYWPFTSLSHKSFRRNLGYKIQDFYLNPEKKFAIKVVYTKFVSQIEYVATTNKLLPLKSKEEVEQNKEESKLIHQDLEFEPEDKIEILNNIIHVYATLEIFGLYKHSIASEHTARRVAMENATRNGEDLMRKLKIKMNRTRQAKITQEIAEITGGNRV